MENQEQTQATPQPELSLSDLQNLKVIIDMSVRRGAFAANELSAVGAVYDKLNNFLTAVLPKQETTTDQNNGQST
jgi:hypothetical protein